MLTIRDTQTTSQFCDGTSRRDFLKIGMLAWGGLGLADLLRLQSAEASTAVGRGKSVIFVFLPGGPSHLDMYDMKPDAPVEIRGEFSPIDTNVAGMRVCELLPKHAKIADKFAVVNGVQTLDTHSGWNVMTGFSERDKRPVFGSVVSRVRGSLQGHLPTYVALNNEGNSDPGEPFYLGSAHRPFTPNGPTAQSLSLVREVSLKRLEDRKRLLQALDTLAEDIDDLHGNISGNAAYKKQALEMIGSPKTREAFDVSLEPEAARTKYGKATRLLLALRLAQAGVPAITVSLGGSCLPAGGWDTHGALGGKGLTNFQNLRSKLPVYDQAVASLLGDLYDRGLDKDVLVVVCGEFGRTPRVNRNGGRDHWAPSSSVLFAGGGLRMGQVIGDSGPQGERANGEPYTSQNVLATIYRHLGIDSSLTFRNHDGRPMFLLDDRRPIRELI